jgi:hypothetical protein
MAEPAQRTADGAMPALGNKIVMSLCCMLIAFITGHVKRIAELGTPAAPIGCYRRTGRGLLVEPCGPACRGRTAGPRAV